MTAELDVFVAALRNAFAGAKNKYVAHERARPILQDLAASPAALTTIIEKHLALDDALDRQHYPVVSFEIDTNKHFGLVANSWIPLPGGETDMSTKAVHHHGSMLLTTVTAFGPGYVHWMFTAPQVVDEAQELFSMRLLNRSPHPSGHASFVDANIPHVPFFPASLTITLALWSTREAASWKDTIKRVPALHKHSAALRGVATSLGLARTLDLNIPKYFDFSPAPRGFHGMKDREEFSRGPNEDYLRSLFHVIQGTGSDGLAPLIRARIVDASPNRALVLKLVSDLEHGRPIEGRLSPGHYGVPFANFNAAAIERALEACGS